MNVRIAALACFLALTVTACASWIPQGASKQTGSIVDYLYPDAKEAPQMKPTVTTLRPPVRVGIAFVPGGAWNSGLPEAEKTKLLERIKESFAKYPFIGGIEVIPTQYLRAKGGFTNLEQVSRMFNVEVVALLSYDQVQFNDSNVLSLLYWTIVGAYVIHGDQYDIQTMLDASVFDVGSRKLLFRAPGLSQVKGSAAMVGFNEQARAARLDGYNKAVDDLVPQLQAQLEGFKERIKTDKAFRVENKAGYSGGGDAGWLIVLLAAGFGAARLIRRRQP
jgi:rhombotail lipoprotein